MQKKTLWTACRLTLTSFQIPKSQQRVHLSAKQCRQLSRTATGIAVGTRLLIFTRGLENRKICYTAD